jgi:hypothetical protein
MTGSLLGSKNDMGFNGKIASLAHNTMKTTRILVFRKQNFTKALTMFSRVWKIKTLVK